jgi:hypothetical protein
MPYEIQPQLIVAVAVFALCYGAFVIDRLRKRRIDLYDFLLLQSLALIPLIFAAAPSVGAWVARTVGVAVPLSAMFGILFVIAFMSFHRAMSRIHRLEGRLTAVTQDLALLRLQVEERNPNGATAAESATT